MKFHTLYTCGDSWTQGEELESNESVNKLTNMYYNSYPWFVSQNLQIPILVNEALGGGSNLRIFRKTSKFILDYLNNRQNPKDLLIIVGWTTTERSEIGIENRVIPLTIQNPSFRNMPVHLKDDLIDYNKKYYELYSDNYNESMLLIYMLNLTQLCKQLDIKFFQFCAIGKPPTYYSRQTELLKDLYPETWHEIVCKNNYTTHQSGHPTRETHRIWADIISEKIK